MSSIDKDIEMNLKVQIAEAKKKIKEIQKELKEAGNKASEAGNKGKQGMDKMGKSADKAKNDLTAVAVSLTGVTSGITGMATALTGMNEKLLSIERSVFGIKQSTLSMTRQQEDLNMALRDGSISALDAKRAAEDLALSYEDVTLQTKEMEGQQLSMHSETVALGISMVSTSVNSVIAVKALGLTHKVTSASVIAGNIGMTATTHAFGTALKVALPFLIPITLAFAAWETNAAGIRDIIAQLTGIEMPSFNEAMNNAFGATTDFNGAMEDNLRIQNMIPGAMATTTKAFKNYGDFMEFQTNLITGNTEALGFNSEANSKYHREITINTEAVVESGRAYTSYSAALKGQREELQKAREAQAAQNDEVRDGTAANNEYAMSIDDVRKKLASGFNIPGITGGSGKSLSGKIHQANAQISAENELTREEMLDLVRLEALVNERHALFEAGLKPFGNSRNISGLLTMSLESMRAAGRTKNSFTNSSQVHGTSTGGVSLGVSSSRGLTRSNKRRRSGRNRNARGRNDKLSVQFRKASEKLNGRLSAEFGVDFAKFTGVSFSKRGSRRGGTHRQAAIAQYKAALTMGEAKGRERMGIFNETTEGAELMEALTLINTGFGKTRFDVFDNDSVLNNQIKNVIMARNFFRGKEVDFDGMSKSGVSGLLNIKEFGFREMNEQLAFQSNEQYQSVGT